jgi:hypothetical protein
MALAFQFVLSQWNGRAADLAARGLAVGIVSNTTFKLALAVALGRGPFRRLTGAGLAALAGAGLGVLLLY